MHRSYRILGLLTAAILCAEVAHAGLVRTTGRGSLSRNFSQDFFFVKNEDINFLGGEVIGIKPEVYEGGAIFQNSIVRGVGGGGRGLGAVPNNCINGYTQADVDDAISDVQSQLQFIDFTQPGAEELEQELFDQLNTLESGNPFPGEPCAWEFAEDEDIFTFGFFSLFFDTPDVTYDVDWGISGVSLDGAVNEMTIPAPDPSFNIDKGWVTLDAGTPASLGLVAGQEYAINVSVSLLSSTGMFFWESRDPDDPVEIPFVPRCVENPEAEAFFNDDSNFDDNGNVLPGLVEPPFEICGYNSVDSFDEVSMAPTFFSSENEIFRVTAANGPVDNGTVAAPSTLGVLLAGMGALLHRRRSAAQRRATLA